MNHIARVDVCRKCLREGIAAELQRHLIADGKHICCRCGTSWKNADEQALPSDVVPVVSELMLNYMFELVQVSFEFKPDENGVFGRRNEVVLRNRADPSLECVITWTKLDLIHPPTTLSRFNVDTLEAQTWVPPFAEAVIRKVAQYLPDEDTVELGKRGYNLRKVARRNHGYADLFVVVNAEITWTR